MQNPLARCCLYRDDNFCKPVCIYFNTDKREVAFYCNSAGFNVKAIGYSGIGQMIIQVSVKCKCSATSTPFFVRLFIAL